MFAIYCGIRMSFQSTRPRGARPYQRQKIRSLLNFNPRAHEGRDRAAHSQRSSLPNFNPRAHEGRDKSHEILWLLEYYFNPRAHEGRD